MIKQKICRTCRYSSWNYGNSHCMTCNAYSNWTKKKKEEKNRKEVEDD